MTTYYLYVKTHTVTGLKYLGQTRSKDPHAYAGSGYYWGKHLKKHGKFYNTEILKECASKTELTHWGTYYSELWDVVNSTDDAGNKLWANLKPETGEGGWYLWGDKNPQKRPEAREKVSKSLKKFFSENPKTEKQKKQHSDWNKEYWTDERKKSHPVEHSINTVSVTDLQGNSKRIPKQDYDSMDRSLPIQEWLYVSVSSKEAKRRKHP